MYGFAITGLLLLLLALVVWDRRRIQREKVAPLARSAMKRGWKAKPTSEWPVLAGFAAITATMLALELHSPSQPPFEGKWASVKSAVHGALGTYGVAALWLAVTVLLLVLALVSWQVARERGH